MHRPSSGRGGRSLLHVQAIRGSWHDRSPHGSVSCLLFIRAGSPCRHPPSLLGKLNVSPSCSPLSGGPCHSVTRGVGFHS